LSITAASTSVGGLPEPSPKPQVHASIQRAPSSMAARLLATARDIIVTVKADADLERVAQRANPLLNRIR